MLEDKQLGVRPRSRVEMLEYGQAILVCPVVEHIAKKEDRGDFQIVIMTRRLWVKEILAFFENQNISAHSNPRMAKKINLGCSLGQIRLHRAISPSSTMARTCFYQHTPYLDRTDSI
jgi:hypothetical protein